MNEQPEGSHVHWPLGYDDANETGTEAANNIHRMNGVAKDRSSSWSVRLPNDEFVSDEAVTLEDMRAKGAV